jgi:hypothetical protein
MVAVTVGVRVTTSMGALLLSSPMKISGRTEIPSSAAKASGKK